MKALALTALALTSAAAPSLQTMLLKPSQVAKGYGVYARSDGFGVKSAPTLDLCGQSGYKSEKLRSNRLQVNYLPAKAKLRTAKALGLSNEVVTYRDGGAKLAIAEVRRHATHCPARPIKTGASDVPKAKFTITPLHDSKLLPGSVAVRVRTVATVKGKHYNQVSYAVYQRLGNVLSGVYSFGPNTAAQLRFALHAAEQSAKVLRRVVNTPQGPPA